MENMSLINRLKPTDHRQGQLQKFVDAVQALINLQYEKFTDENGIQLKGVKTFEERSIEILQELRQWDVTEIGNLYLTSGGRVVLDKGYGEYFNKGDLTIFTLEELKHGIPFDAFLKRVTEVKTERQKMFEAFK